MVLYNEAELQEKKNKRQKIIFAGVLIVFVLGVAMAGYNLIKPIPNTPACEKQGYEAGNFVKGVEYCYSGCIGKEINSCELRKVAR